MESVVRNFKIGDREDRYDVDVITTGNFSGLTRGESISVYSLEFAEILVDLFSQFEKRLNVRITNWETLKDGGVLFRHEPKEKARVAHLPEFEPDARL